MLLNEFKINKVDKCVYVKKKKDNGYVIVCLYVDDMQILSSNNHVIKSTKNMIIKNFNMKDLDITDVIIGIKNYRTFDGMVVS
jgi:hypothetical protein